MKTTRLILSLILLTAGLTSANHAAAAERVSLRGILISASNTKRESDRRLAAYEPTLRSILRFESYRYLGEDHTMLKASEKSELLVGDGLRLEIDTERADGQSAHIRVRWATGGGKNLMGGAFVLRPGGAPVVLGGPASDNPGEVYAVILFAR